MNLMQMLRTLPDPGADGFRNEHKYICSAAELGELKIRLAALLMPDPHSGPDGQYRVRSLYWDTYDDRLVRENEDGTSPREKWRIRSYNLDRSYVALECKMHEGDHFWMRSSLTAIRRSAARIRLCSTAFWCCTIRSFCIRPSSLIICGRPFSSRRAMCG